MKLTVTVSVSDELEYRKEGYKVWGEFGHQRLAVVSSDLVSIDLSKALLGMIKRAVDEGLVEILAEEAEKMAEEAEKMAEEAEQKIEA